MLITWSIREKRTLNDKTIFDPSSLQLLSISARKSESISSLNSELDDMELLKLRQDRERLEDELSEKKAELEDAKAIGVRWK